MLLVCGTDKTVVADPETVPERAILCGDRIGPLLGILARSGRRALDLLSMLIGAGEEERVRSEHSLTARNYITHDRGVRMPDVRTGIHVINRSSDVKLRAFFHSDPSLRRQWLLTMR